MNLQELSHLSPKSILDIGANVGDWSKQAKLVWPDAFIFMVEANPECEPLLKETGFPYKIDVLSDKESEVTFYQRKCGGTSTGDSMYREDTQWYDDENVVVTKRHAVPLDSICSGSFQLAKLDVQGAELNVLRGGAKLFSLTSSIIMEIPVDSQHPPYNIGAPTRKEVLDYMYDIGFTKLTILESIVHPIHRYEIQQDVLFERE